MYLRFTDIALRQPDREALIDDDGSVTYSELYDAAGKVVAALSAVSTGDDRLVAARFRRGRSAPIGFLGILGSGLGYVPVDPDYPPQRQAFLLDDCGARLLLTDGQLLPDEKLLGKVGDLTIATRQQFRGEIAHAVPAETAYVIYTSGSTGTPKGCVIGNDQVLALLDACAKLFQFSPADTWTVFHSFSFDFSVWELWGALLNGSTAVLIPKQVAVDPDAFMEVLTVRRVTVCSQTPSMFGFLVKQLSQRNRSLPHLRYAVLGGEALNVQDVLTWLECGMAPNARLVNMYGITETTVHVTYAELNFTTCHSAYPTYTPIGRPLPHLEVSLRDATGQSVADGTPGEIWVAGSGVASGYLGRDDLTRERFIVECVDGLTRRHYRSGDWAIRDSGGELYYIGRIDGQVKIRGHRVELGEVEAVIAALGGVESVACAIQTHGADQHLLVAYLVTDSKTALDPGRIRSQLSQHLPAHMRPHQFKRVAGLPVNAHGKLDRSVLGSLPTLDWSIAAIEGCS
jgi:nonribosomal peptide synthetase DhbF